MPQMKVTLGIGLANCRQTDVIEIDDEWWTACETEEQREDLMNEYWQDWANNYIDGSTEIIE